MQSGCAQRFPKQVARHSTRTHTWALQISGVGALFFHRLSVLRDNAREIPDLEGHHTKISHQFPMGEISKHTPQAENFPR